MEASLERKHLSLVTYFRSSRPLLSYNNATGAYSGLSFELWKEMAAEVGFTFSISYVPRPDGSTTRWAAQVLNSTSGYDFALNLNTLAKGRLIFTDMTVPVMPYGFIPAVLKPSKVETSVLSTIATFLQPFHPSLWLTIVLAIVLSGLFIWFLERKYDHELKGRGGMLYSVWLSSMAFTQAGGAEARTAGGRLFSVMWTFVVVVLLATYTANLAAFFGHVDLSAPPSNLDEIRATGRPVCAFGGTGSIFMEHNNLPYIRVPRRMDGALMVLNGSCVAFIDKDFELAWLLSQTGRHPELCRLHVVGQALSYSFAGIIANVRKPVQYLNALNHAIASLYPDGRQLAIINRILRLKPVRACPALTTATTALRVGQLGGLFLLLLATGVAALALHFTESARHRAMESMAQAVAVPRALAVAAVGRLSVDQGGGAYDKGSGGGYDKDCGSDEGHDNSDGDADADGQGCVDVSYGGTLPPIPDCVALPAATVATAASAAPAAATAAAVTSTENSIKNSGGGGSGGGSGGGEAIALLSAALRILKSGQQGDGHAAAAAALLTDAVAGTAAGDRHDGSYRHDGYHHHSYHAGGAHRQPQQPHRRRGTWNNPTPIGVAPVRRPPAHVPAAARRRTAAAQRRGVASGGGGGTALFAVARRRLTSYRPARSRASATQQQQQQQQQRRRGTWNHPPTSAAAVSVRPPSATAATAAHTTAAIRTNTGDGVDTAAAAAATAAVAAAAPAPDVVLEMTALPVTEKGTVADTAPTTAPPGVLAGGLGAALPPAAAATPSAVAAAAAGVATHDHSSGGGRC